MVAFLDDDDVWAPGKLATQLRAAEEEGAGWAYTGDVNVDEDLRVLSGGPPPDPEEVVGRLPRYNPLSSGASKPNGAGLPMFSLSTWCPSASRRLASRMT